MRYYFLLLLPLMFGCSSNSGTKPVSEKDSATMQTDKDSLSTFASTDDCDWTPEEFKKEHHDEWAAVKPSINILQRKGDTDFAKIDLLVKDYIAKKKISLPSEAGKQIKYIDQICRTKFDIGGYDDSNMGKHIADATRRLFAMYINWLYEKEATKVLSHNRLVDIERELELYENLNNAMFDVCDSVAFCMGGSGGWVGAAQVHDLSVDFQKCMYQAIIGTTLEQKKELDVPLDLFDKECKALNDNYEPFEDEQPKDISQIANRFKRAFHIWYAYRKSIVSGLKDKKFKKAYESITYSFARIHFLHLKNRFSDIGLMSNDMVEHCLEVDCTNKELLDFNYEAKWKELFGSE